MTDRNLTHIYALLDRSGSMASIRADMEGGFDQFVAEQAGQPGVCRVSLAQFDTDFDIVYWDKAASDVPNLHITPRGATALHDALGRYIGMIGERLGPLSEEQRPGAVIVYVVTDGLENSSREYHAEQIKALIETQTNQWHWLFMYLGSNQDAVLVGESLGFGRGHTMTYTGKNAGHAVLDSIGNVAAYRSSVASGEDYYVAAAAADFTEDQREDATKK